MTIFDLLFLASALAILVLAARAAFFVFQGRWKQGRRAGFHLSLFVAAYAVALISVSRLTPRRFYAPGERRCFDDWCVAALNASPAASPAQLSCSPQQGSRIWIVTAEVSSDAKRVRQRAPDARAELEDKYGQSYQPCIASKSTASEPGVVHGLTDELEPGESFRVTLPFRLPERAEPAGLVIHHGDFPGLLVIGTPHVPALMRFAH